MKGFFQSIASVFKRSDFTSFALQFQSDGQTWTSSTLDEKAQSFGITSLRAREHIAELLIDEGRGAADGAALVKVREKAVAYGNRLNLPTNVLVRGFAEVSRQMLAFEYEKMFAAGAVDLNQVGDLAERLRLNDGQASEIVRGCALAHIQKYVGQILADGRVDPSEDSGLEQLRIRTGAQALEFDPASSSALDQARRRWALEQETLVEVPCPLILQRNERCFLTIVAQAAEMRQRTVRVNYGGTTASIRIMKGVRYRVGSIRVERQTEDYEHTFGVGTLCLTDRRLLWSGPNKSLSYLHSSIIDLTGFSNAIEVRRTSGKPMRFYFLDDPAPAIISQRLLRNGGGPLD